MTEAVAAKALSQKEMNSYRLTSMEEPGDERMAQIMRDCRECPRKHPAGLQSVWLQVIEAASQEARTRVEETLNRLRDGDKCAQAGPDSDCRAQWVGQNFRGSQDSASAADYYKTIIQIINKDYGIKFKLDI